MSHVPENPDAGLVAVKCAIEMKLGWQGWRRTLQWFAPKLIINASLSIEVREWDSCQEFPVRHTRNSSSSAAALSSSLEYELSCLQIDKFVDDGFNSSSHIVPSFRSVMFLIASHRVAVVAILGLALLPSLLLMTISKTATECWLLASSSWQRQHSREVNWRRSHYLLPESFYFKARNMRTRKAAEDPFTATAS